MAKGVEKQRFIEKFAREIEQDTAAIFAGAGFSVAAGYINWRDLLREIADEMGLSVDRESDLISVAQFHVNNQQGNRDQLNRAIIDCLSADAKPTPNHTLLARLPIKTWWTTNYDKVIEEAQRQEGKTPDVKYTVSQLAFTKPGRDVTVFKMHGDVDHPNEAVLIRDDYERYEKDKSAFLTSLFGDLISKTFLFVGFSFSDPNLSKVLSHIRVHFEKGQRTHYAIFKTPSVGDFKKIEDYEYEKRKQDLVLEDLKRFNIHAVVVDEFREIDEIIEGIYRKFLFRHVFVSTSAHDYTPWGEGSVTSFMEKLGSLLVDRDMKLVTGVGLGAGNAVLGGAIVGVSRDPSKKIDDYLIIRPFPQYVDDPSKRDAIWHSYREDMIGRAGIGIFLFGNKLVGGEVLPASGMTKEFEIAKEKGLFLVPVGATGSIAKDLGGKILEETQPLHLGAKGDALLIALQEPVDDLDNLLGPILDLLDLIREGRDLNGN